MGTKTRDRGIAVLRIVMGWVFFYAGAEKLLGVGLEAGKTWSAGGFLKFATAGSWPGAADGAIINPTHDFWVSLAGNAQLLGIINVLVPVGEVAIGAALILGLATRFASLMGVVMVGLFYVASWDFALGIVNSDVVYMAVTGFLGVVAAGEVYGLDPYVERLRFVQRAPALHYVLG
jgi:thiosulfate dehydrogenase [quinone] large subunit